MTRQEPEIADLRARRLRPGDGEERAALGGAPARDVRNEVDEEGQVPESAQNRLVETTQGDAAAPGDTRGRACAGEGRVGSARGSRGGEPESPHVEAVPGPRLESRLEEESPAGEALEDAARRA